MNTGIDKLRILKEKKHKGVWGLLMERCSFRIFEGECIGGGGDGVLGFIKREAKPGRPPLHWICAWTKT